VSARNRRVRFEECILGSKADGSGG
jgi:hypothetical protein